MWYLVMCLPTYECASRDTVLQGIRNTKFLLDQAGHIFMRCNLENYLELITFNFPT
jgi:hypothetical protein